MITFEKKLADHRVKITAVVEQQYEQNNGSEAGSSGFSSNALIYNNLALGNDPQIPSSYFSSRSLMSYMGRANYAYRDLYLLTLTGRADGSSVFGDNNKWGFFPSAALGWNIINERFFKSFRHIFSQLKLRASYGITGNQAIQPYQSLASLNSGYQYPVNGESLSVGVGLGNIENPDLKWEKTTQVNIGLDIQLFSGRLDITADVYTKETSDLLLIVPLPMTPYNGYQLSPRLL